MATLNSYVTVLRLIYLMLGICNFVNAKYSVTTSCSGSVAEIKFGKSEAKEPIYNTFYFTSAENQKIKIAKVSNMTPDYYEEYKSFAVIDKNILYLKNINNSHSGNYTRTVRDDSNGRGLYTDIVNLKVISPPSSFPILDIEKEENCVKVSCKPPKGYPEAQLELRDSTGKLQDSLTIYGSDNWYQCCITGEASKCMRRDFLCQTKELGGCQKCFISTFVSWIVMPFFLIVFFSIHVGCEKNMRINVHIIRKKMKMLFFQAVPGVVLSVFLIVALSVSLWTDQKNCKHSVAVCIFFGVGSSIIMFIPNIFLKICSKYTEAENSKTSKLDVNEVEDDMASELLDQPKNVADDNEVEDDMASELLDQPKNVADDNETVGDTSGNRKQNTVVMYRDESEDDVVMIKSTNEQSKIVQKTQREELTQPNTSVNGNGFFTSKVEDVPLLVRTPIQDKDQGVPGSSDVKQLHHGENMTATSSSI